MLHMHVLEVYCPIRMCYVLIKHYHVYYTVPLKRLCLFVCYVCIGHAHQRGSSGRTLR